jgi:hypothetical protein
MQFVRQRTDRAACGVLKYIRRSSCSESVGNQKELKMYIGGGAILLIIILLLFLR